LIKIAFLEKPERLVEIALKKAIKESRGKKPWQKKEEKKIVCFSNYLIKRLETAASRVPSEKKLGSFNYELLKTMESERNLKQMRAHFLAGKKLLSKRKRVALRGVRRASEKAKHFSELAGRSNSILKSMRETFNEFNSLQRKLRELPYIDPNAKTIVLAGYPNAGKTTILKRLTGSKAKVADYAFTTQKLNLGSFEWKHRKIQVVDTPGLLDRKPEKRNQIEKKATLALSRLSDLVCFVVDCTESTGLKEQLALFKSVKKEFTGKKTIALLNKVDIATSEEVKRCKQLFGTTTLIEFKAEKTSEIRNKIGEILYENTNKR